MRSFAVAHVSKMSSGGIGSHIDRKHTIKNADPDRLHLNQELCENKKGSIHQDINQRIQEGYTSNRAIRKDAVKMVGVMLSGSNEKMKDIEKNGQLDEWAQKNYEFAKDRFGRENIVRFTLHLDETTPHIHCVFVPIDKEGKLRFKSFFKDKNDLKKFQDDYAAAVNKFGLERGLKNSRTRHTTTRQFYAEVNSEAEKFEVVKGTFGGVKVEETTKAAQDLIARQAAITFNMEKERKRAERDLELSKTKEKKAVEGRSKALEANQGFVKYQKGIRTVLKSYFNPNSAKEVKEKAEEILLKQCQSTENRKLSSNVKQDVKDIFNEDKQQRRSPGPKL